ncbi:pectinesterase family protein [Hymenobacter sp. GOD-10R]|uniref:pectinesterase family protein n=1 Tax=Hymenobacter sp. GOD-10R TaxID=3093922 RepID=UPI002D77BAE3|nr:pectinesterase family protein [Hymenobacter sp. GOD-10R]WRQ27972.1 pectinesterase family protein [Hymenobacter sp. GOD-10R]
MVPHSTYRAALPTNKRWFLLVLLLLGSAFYSPLFAYDLVVAKDGSGNYKTVQAAIDAVPTGRTSVYTIFIKNGIYQEKVTVPANKPFVQLIGESVANTILTWNDNANTPNGSGGTLGTGGSGSVTVNATDFSALNITFVNSFGDGSQAVAVSLYADRAAFKNCRFQGNQDTLLNYGNGRQYFKDCYIDGNVDFIFGNAIALFDNCVIYAKTRTTAGSSFITAANTPPGQTYGYVFRNTKIPSNTGGTQYYLGRPWQNSTGSSPLAENKVVFLKTTIGANQILPAGWVTWDAGTDVTKITYAEYQTRYFNGKLVPVNQRVTWSKQLTSADTAQYVKAKLFGTWDPCTVVAGFCTTLNTPDIAVSNFRATKGATQATLDWNISWAMSQIKYELFRSTDNVTFNKIYEATAQNDSTYNFQATDALPAAGNIYYYYLRASKAGLATHTTPTIEVSSVPTINITGGTITFAQYSNGPSAPQTYVLAGVNLLGSVTITPPPSYEVSANGGTTWYNSATPLVLSQANNTLASTTISVRLNASAAGTYGGNIVHTSTGAAPVNVAVNGTKVNTPQPVSVPLQWWPLKVNNQDSAAVRSTSVIASSSTLRNFYVSNGTTVPAIKAYSKAFGQALGASANGDGTWVPNPSSNPNRRYYEEFTLTTSPNSTSIRVDSLVFTAGFYGTANGRLAVLVSRSGFVSDSTELTGGRGPVGSLNSSTGLGTFASPLVLANQTNGVTTTFRYPLNSTTGLTISTGQKLTVRLYFSAGTTSAGRYSLLKDVHFKGERLNVTAANKPLAGTSFHVYPNPTHEGNLTVELGGYAQDVTLTLCNALGQQIFSTKVKAGQTQKVLPLGKLASGVYMLRAQSQGGTDVRRIVRE